MKADDIAALLLRLSSAYAETPLAALPRLAAAFGVAEVLAKDEGRRMLGSFKSLGGTYAGLRVLARHAGCTIEALLDPATRPTHLPPLLCASDGNHGLAVAAAARFGGGGARIYLHRGVGAVRAGRIGDLGAQIAWIDGTYDDAVDAAAAAAAAGDGLLVPDTAPLADPVVTDVMAGYGVIAAEIRRQCEGPRPTHLFVQAGVGGLAAALAQGLDGWLAPPARIVAVEPSEAACVSAAMTHGAPVRIAGSLATAAEMLSCGEASAPAIAALRRCGATTVTVPEPVLMAAPRLLRTLGGPTTTPSGAAGLAGIMELRDRGAAAAFGIDAGSRILIIVTEADLVAAA